MYNAYVTRIKNVRNHPGADRLLLGECFGNTVCVTIEYTEKDNLERNKEKILFNLKLKFSYNN